MKGKKAPALLLSVLLLFTWAVFAAAEGDALPESAHNYENNANETWFYSLDDAPNGVVITFSEDTYVEAGYDRIELYDENGGFIGNYSGGDLAGASVYVPTVGFSILLITDNSVTAYGFRITDVRAAAADEVSAVTYHSCMDDIQDVTLTFCSAIAQTASPPEFEQTGYYLAGWATKEGGDVRLEPYEIPTAGERELWAVWVKLLLDEDEIFDFNNSGFYFNVDGKEHYYITKENYRMMQRNLFKTYGLGPYPTPIVSTVLATYPNWEWEGSCYGISTVTALQHFGLIDVLSLQGAENMAQMQPDENLISYINYYQSQVATSWLTENKASVPGSALYKTQLQNMFQSVQDGKLVMFTFYSGAPLVSNGHTVLLTGAYTNAAGEHVLIAYDNNDPWAYGEAYGVQFTISADWSSIGTEKYYDGKLKAIHWTNDFSQFTSFDINGDGSMLKWHQTYLRHLFRGFRVLFRTLQNLFRR